MECRSLVSSSESSSSSSSSRLSYHQALEVLIPAITAPAAAHSAPAAVPETDTISIPSDAKHVALITVIPVLATIETIIRRGQHHEEPCIWVEYFKQLTILYQQI